MRKNELRMDTIVMEMLNLEIALENVLSDGYGFEREDLDDKAKVRSLVAKIKKENDKQSAIALINLIVVCVCSGFIAFAPVATIITSLISIVVSCIQMSDLQNNANELKKLDQDINKKVDTLSDKIAKEKDPKKKDAMIDLRDELRNAQSMTR